MFLTMYKAPQNSNRVKSIKSKFENIEHVKSTTCAGRPTVGSSSSANLSKTESKTNSKPSSSDIVLTNHQPVLARQLSDPAKCNIKRTPAFRVDKNVENLPPVKKNPQQKTLFETKVKQFNSVKSCDNKPEDYFTQYSPKESTSIKPKLDMNIGNNSFLHSEPTHSFNSFKPPLLIKSKSSHDFKKIQNVSRQSADKLSSCTDGLKYGENDHATDLEETILLKDVDLSLLYTEPIPKSLRLKQTSESSSSTTESPIFKPKMDNIYTKSTLQLSDIDKKVFLESLKKVLSTKDMPGALTDSLRTALKKPLPQGPAPQKPPRTFQHCTDAVLISKSNISNQKKDTSVNKSNSSKKSYKRSDPKYMLNKLELALKNNKLRVRKQQKVDLSTSGEDSDDSLLFQSKSCRSLSKPTEDNLDSEKNFDCILGDLNCFNKSICGSNPVYEQIPESTSSFFVDMDKDPIYAEPLKNEVRLANFNSTENSVQTKNRNSLYYMSTTLIPEDTGQAGAVNSTSFPHLLSDDCRMEDLKVENHTPSLSKQILTDNSSLSSFTSDMDSTPSPVTDDTQAKIQYLIENFEQKRQILPKTERPQSLCHTTSKNDNGSSNRVEILRNSLKQTIDRSFSNDCTLVGLTESDYEEGKVARMVARFRTFQKTAPKYQQPKINKDTLFYCCLVIEKVKDCAQIKFKFPSNVDIPRDIEQLCFPESSDSPPLEGSSAAQTYTLLVTSETGDRTYGYCRRVLPEGSTYCLPLAYCILSKYRAPRFYKKILLELECRHGIQDKFREQLISQFYHKKFPKPGECISIDLTIIEGPTCIPSHELEESWNSASYVHVKKTGEYASFNNRTTSIFVSENDVMENSSTPSYVTYEGHKTELVLTLHSDTRYEDADLKKLHKLPSDILLKIFSSLLLERKVILISSTISELSSCVDSLQSILYPFTWYHTFIPILPQSLWDIVESPTPVVCGVLSAEAVVDRHIENGIVVNLDTQTVTIEEGDETKILSSSLHKVWRQFISLANNNKSHEYVYSVYLADAYLNVFICCFKNYKRYIKDRQFLKEDLIKSGKTKGIRRFLKMFTETCMFHAFMDTAINNPESLAAFDKKIELYGSEESQIILDKLIDWHR